MVFSMDGGFMGVKGMVFGVFGFCWRVVVGCVFVCVCVGWVVCWGWGCVWFLGVGLGCVLWGLVGWVLAFCFCLLVWFGFFFCFFGFFWFIWVVFFLWVCVGWWGW